MDYNNSRRNYHHNNDSRRNYQSSPYDRGPSPYRGRGNRRPIRRPYQKPYYSKNYNNPERTFDESGRAVFGNQPQFSQAGTSAVHEEVPIAPQQSPLETKAKQFLETVLDQQGVRSQLIFLQTIENPQQILQGTADYCQLQLTLDIDNAGLYLLKIGNEELAKGKFTDKQTAKATLCAQVLDDLKKDCFYIIKKKVYEDVARNEANDRSEANAQTTFKDSKAHQMMLKMGWGGKGLGANEQGVEQTVAETIDQNISRQGLGTDDVFRKIHKMLEEYSMSDKMSLLRFDPDFTSDERAHIHNIAKKFGLKSKSEGKGNDRRITVTKKLNRTDLVYNLLTCGLENDLYQLEMPAKFQHLWLDNDDDEEDGNYRSHFST